MQKSVFDLRSCGAVGDGNADDSAAFAYALRQAEDFGSALYVPPGTYSLATYNPQNTGNVIIYGSGDCSKLVGNGDNLLLYPAVSTSVSISNLSLESFRYAVEYTAATYGDLEISRIKADSLSRGLVGSGGGVSFTAGTVKIQDNRISDSGRIAVKLAVTDGESISVVGNTIDGVGNKQSTEDTHGVWVSSDNAIPLLVHGNTVKGVSASNSASQVSGIMVLGTQARIADNHVENVVCDDHPTNPDGIYSKSPGAIITGNVVCEVNAGEGAFNLKENGPPTTKTAKGTILANNQCRSESGVSVNIAAPNISVINNTINGGVLAIRVGDSDTVISGNRITETNGNAIQISSSQTTIDRVHITNNIFDQIKDRACYPATSKSSKLGHLTFANNVLTRFTGIETFAIRTALDSDQPRRMERLTVVGNQMDETLKYAVSVGAKPNGEGGIVEVDGNKISGTTDLYGSSLSWQTETITGNTQNGTPIGE